MTGFYGEPRWDRKFIQKLPHEGSRVQVPHSDYPLVGESDWEEGGGRQRRRRW
jgi:hypothetical protein